MAERLYKSRTDRMLFGVSGGLAEYFDVDPTLVRIAWVIVGILTAGVALLAYIALAVIVPERVVKPATESITVKPAAESVEDGEEPAPCGPSDPDGAPVDRGRGRRRSIIGGTALIVIGVLFLAYNLGLLDWFDWGRFWPVLLILLGLLLVARRIGGRSRDG